MSGLRDVLHFSFTVADLEASIDWYTRVLGLELVHRQRQENTYTEELVGIEGAVLEIAQFRVPGVSPGLSTHMLELVEYVRPKLEPANLQTNRPGVAHIAFLVTDIHDRYEAMVDAGVEFRNPPTTITEGANAGGFACYLRDPEGITLELLQPPPERIAGWK
ncbi:MAG TPA: VOC family protein [Solirubrobacterales bacterium]|nr:VOC family protein [Solirubrobacterales bacterium]